MTDMSRSTPRPSRILAFTIAAWLVALPAASAQEPATRAEADRQRREKKQAAAKPYQPNRFERAMHFAEERAVFILDREGFYPKLGSLTVGSGFAAGLGFRDRDLFANKGALDLWSAASIRGYWAAEIRLTFPELAARRLLVESWASRRDYPQESFFGLGPDSNRSDRSDYAIRTNYAGGRVGVRPLRPVLLGGGLEFLQPRVGRGRNTRVPDVSELFNPAEVPGLTASADFLRSSAFLEVDYREPKNARRGGWYRVDFSHYDDRTAGAYTFNRVDADLRQFVGVLAGRRVLAARVFVSTSDTTGNQAVPFYLMPTLGGNDTLRGFREYRFRGPHAILLQGEYRWEIWSGLDAALFYDAGKVADRRADLDFTGLQSDYGFGFRFNTNSGVIFRADAAFGSRDGRHFYIVFGGVF
jgi:surface antigen Omp85-like protein